MTCFELSPNFNSASGNIYFFILVPLEGSVGLLQVNPTLLQVNAQYFWYCVSLEAQNMSHETQNLLRVISKSRPGHHWRFAKLPC